MDLVGQRPRLVATATDHDRHRVLVHAHRSVAFRRVCRRGPYLTASRGTPGRDAHCGYVAQSARLGWMPFYPQFNVNPLDLADQAEAAVEAGEAPDVGSYVANALAAGTIKMAVEDPDAPENWPRTLTLWRANLFGSSAKGN